MNHQLFTFLPMAFFTLLYLIVIIGIIVFIFRAIKKSQSLKEEQNALLRQLVYNPRRDEKQD